MPVGRVAALAVFVVPEAANMLVGSASNGTRADVLRQQAAMPVLPVDVANVFACKVLLALEAAENVLNRRSVPCHLDQALRLSMSERYWVVA